MKNPLKGLFVYILAVVLISVVANFFMFGGKSSQESLPYSTLISMMQNGKVHSLSVGNFEVNGQDSDGHSFVSAIPSREAVTDKALEYNVPVTLEVPEKNSWLLEFGMTMLPTLLLIGVWIFMMRGMAGGKMTDFAKNKAKLFIDNKPPATFADVAGCIEAKEELAEVVEFLRDPSKFTNLGAKVPRGVLLLGPPGTGKTLLARATAGEAHVPFFSTTGSDFLEMFVGVGAARVRDLFNEARKRQPCIVFIDEIDAVGRQRGAGLGGGHDEREQTLNQLLVEMDGFDDKGGIILVAATNRPDVLDPALLRPGRFDRHIVVDAPDVKGREEILKVHTKGKKIASDIDLEQLAQGTPGFVGADLANVVNEAALLAARAGKSEVTQHEFEEAIERTIAGPERRSRIISAEERVTIAYHEVGHALVAHFLPGSDPVHKISIIPRGHAALGYTLQLPQEDRFLKSKRQLLNEICILLAGRATEALKFGEDNVTTGASNDLQRATQIARDIVTQWGMSELGMVVLGKPKHQVFLGRDLAEDRNYSDQTALAIDQAVRQLIDQCFAKVTALLTEHRDQLEMVAQKLLSVEVIHKKEFLQMLGEDVSDSDEEETKETEE